MTRKRKRKVVILHERSIVTLKEQVNYKRRKNDSESKATNATMETECTFLNTKNKRDEFPNCVTKSKISKTVSEADNMTTITKTAMGKEINIEDIENRTMEVGKKYMLFNQQKRHIDREKEPEMDMIGTDKKRKCDLIRDENEGIMTHGKYKKNMINRFSEKNMTTTYDESNESHLTEIEMKPARENEDVLEKNKFDSGETVEENYEETEQTTQNKRNIEAKTGDDYGYRAHDVNTNKNESNMQQKKNKMKKDMERTETSEFKKPYPARSENSGETVDEDYDETEQTTQNNRNIEDKTGDDYGYRAHDVNTHKNESNMKQKKNKLKKDMDRTETSEFKKPNLARSENSGETDDEDYDETEQTTQNKRNIEAKTGDDYGYRAHDVNTNKKESNVKQKKNKMKKDMDRTETSEFKKPYPTRSENSVETVDEDCDETAQTTQNNRNIEAKPGDDYGYRAHDVTTNKKESNVKQKKNKMKTDMDRIETSEFKKPYPARSENSGETVDEDYDETAQTTQNNRNIEAKPGDDYGYRAHDVNTNKKESNVKQKKNKMKKDMDRTETSEFKKSYPTRSENSGETVDEDYGETEQITQNKRNIEAKTGDEYGYRVHDVNTNKKDSNVKQKKHKLKKDMDRTETSEFKKPYPARSENSGEKVDEDFDETEQTLQNNRKVQAKTGDDYGYRAHDVNTNKKDSNVKQKKNKMKTDMDRTETSEFKKPYPARSENSGETVDEDYDETEQTTQNNRNLKDKTGDDYGYRAHDVNTKKKESNLKQKKNKMKKDMDRTETSEFKKPYPARSENSGETEDEDYDETEQTTQNNRNIEDNTGDGYGYRAHDVNTNKKESNVKQRKNKMKKDMDRTETSEFKKPYPARSENSGETEDEDYDETEQTTQNNRNIEAKTGDDYGYRTHDVNTNKKESNVKQKKNEMKKDMNRTETSEFKKPYPFRSENSGETVGEDYDEPKQTTQNNRNIEDKTGDDYGYRAHDVNTNKKDSNVKQKKNKMKTDMDRTETSEFKKPYPAKSENSGETVDEDYDETEQTTQNNRNIEAKTGDDYGYRTHDVNTNKKESNVKQKKNEMKKDMNRTETSEFKKPYPARSENSGETVDEDFDEPEQTTQNNRNIEAKTGDEYGYRAHDVNTNKKESNVKQKKNKMKTEMDRTETSAFQEPYPAKSENSGETFDEDYDETEQTTQNNRNIEAKTGDVYGYRTHDVNTNKKESNVKQKKKKMKKDMNRTETSEFKKPYPARSENSGETVDEDYDEPEQTTQNNRNIEDKTGDDYGYRAHDVNTNKKDSNVKQKKNKMKTDMDRTETSEFKKPYPAKSENSGETVDEEYGETEQTTQNNRKESNVKQKKKKKKKDMDRTETSAFKEPYSAISENYECTGKHLPRVDKEHKSKKNKNNKKKNTNDCYSGKENKSSHDAYYETSSTKKRETEVENIKSRPIEPIQTKHKKKKKEKKLMHHEEMKSDEVMSKKKKKKKKIQTKSDSQSDPQSDQTLHRSKPDNSFKITLTSDIWETIKPGIKVYSSKRKFMKMTGNWTDAFYNEFRKKIPGCTIKFKFHHVCLPNSRKQHTEYATFIAECTGQLCTAKYTFNIEAEPCNREDIIINCTVNGKIRHEVDEINRRNVKSTNRELLMERLQTDPKVSVFYQNVETYPTEMTEGNYTGTPTLDVLRKIASEAVKKEHLHENIIREVQFLKEVYQLEDDDYIREIGLDPFCVLMFNKRQIDLMKSLGKRDELDVYIDATGSVIQNISGQKRPYLYSVVVKPFDNLPGVSVADMLSTEHTIPRIELFILQLKRALKVSGFKSRVRKVETDFSYAILQATLHAFSNSNVKTYLKDCHEIASTGKMNSHFTVFHLCSTHMLKDFITNTSKHLLNLQKKYSQFVKKCFVCLQNATLLKEAVTIFEEICTVLVTKHEIEHVSIAKDSLQQRMIRSNTELEEEDEEISETKYCHIQEMDNEEDENKTIKASSPFNLVFQQIFERVKQIQTNEQLPVNNYFCPEVVYCLLDKFMYLFPLWSGIMLALVTDTEIKTRDTNSPVENWFKIIKNDIGLKRKERPAKFISKLKSVIYGKIQEINFPNARQPKTKKQKRKDKDNVSKELPLAEEVWQKKAKKIPFYQPESKVKKIKRTKQQMAPLPDVANWGGDAEGIQLVNTCTIDNCLTILHLKYIEQQSFRRLVDKESRPVFNTLKTIMTLMSDGSFEEAKLVWCGMTQREGTTRNLYGDETDFFVRHIDTLWKSSVDSICTNPTCPNPYSQSRTTHGILAGFSETTQTAQSMLNQWLLHQENCRTVIQSSGETDILGDERCCGSRNLIRRIEEQSPIIFLRMLEHVRAGRIGLDDLLSNSLIVLNDAMYELAGITMHRNSHYCAVVTSSIYGNVWYDGLIGKLVEVPEDLNTWDPVHAVYCQVT